MNVFRKFIIVSALALIVVPQVGFGQYQFPMKPFLSYFKDIQRYELSFNYTMNNGFFEGVTQATSTAYNTGAYYGDTNVNRAISTTGYGGSIGLSLPFKATGHISCWAATMQLGVNMYTWNNLNSTYINGEIVDPSGDILTASTMNIHLPIGIDWKVGNDAIKSQRLALGASFGAGVIPQVTMTSLSSGTPNSGTNFGFTPFAKVEFGWRWGWVFKLRGMYSMGQYNLLYINREIPGVSDGPFRISSTSNITVSLVIMPFSGGWRETDWWNTFDTYNKHDRFN
ncbi:MAG: hypothetical protein K0Q79_512 [Flavipsychrobacter sp.]|nr:hypothetical protein [Flavipsychrobacter sp.]